MIPPISLPATHLLVLYAIHLARLRLLEGDAVFKAKREGEVMEAMKELEDALAPCVVAAMGKGGAC